MGNDKKRLRKQLKESWETENRERILRVGWHHGQAAGSEHIGQTEKQAATEETALVWCHFPVEFPPLWVISAFLLGALTWLDEVHPHYEALSALSRVNWLECWSHLWKVFPATARLVFDPIADHRGLAKLMQRAMSYTPCSQCTVWQATMHGDNEPITVVT